MTDQKTIDSLKQLIRKQIAEVKEGESPKNMHEMVALLTKAASTGLKAMEGLKSKVKMPSQKATAAIALHLDALESILNDMWQSPMSYLDTHPDDVVAQRRSDLDNRGVAPGPRPTSLDDSENHAVQETAASAMVAGTERVLADPAICPICGSNYDKKVHPTCPVCAKANQKPKPVATTENAKVWAGKLRSTKR